MSNYKFTPTTKFKKDYKKVSKNLKKRVALENCFELLAKNGSESIPQKMHPHQLIGNYKGYYECHILPDLLLIWEEFEEEKEIILHRVGSHSELF